MTNAKTIESNNTAWGFHGTFDRSGHATPANEAWRLALPVVAGLCGIPPEMARDALDSREGRHFADKVLDAQFPKVDERVRLVLESDGGWCEWLCRGALSVAGVRAEARS